MSLEKSIFNYLFLFFDLKKSNDKPIEKYSSCIYFLRKLRNLTAQLGL